ncbi:MULTISPECIES: molecular chaperone DnaJ [unclassified Devosia]|jgi:molecular chaperone DnaJ|uniref:molecular chaperone DnaJ n=1 Tax=unclassified Devosia TaxID=196773 RepID=UPI000927F065|nr:MULTISPECIES: molecular chaperone DnaJ [unclassified Devosia]MBL8599468.1 molecular chaperone DnaJ [Devosia sp.]OJX55093.1 MAG: molecular chaperone DnaJ [Devosia sp. 66-22]
MAKRDFYDVLGVPKGSDEAALKGAYRKLAMQFHPDRNPGNADAEHKFKEINEAYDTLKDPQKRAAYDRFGHAAFEQGGMGRGANGFGPEFTSSMSDIFEDIFGDFMGGGQQRNRGSQSRLRGSDLRYNLEITLEEAFLGRTVEIDVPTLVTCHTCDGSGAKPGTGMSTCKHCSGHGKVRAAQGFFTIERTCPVCQGRGQILENPCTDCGGQGRKQENRKLSVDIPKGIEDGTRIRLANEGEAGLRGGPPGDLYIFVSVKPHDLFHRDGADLYARVPIAMTTAALGGEFEVPTLDGARAKVKVAPGTQPGQRVRLKQKGMPVLRSKDQGDLYVQLDVETPQNLTKRQRELLEEFHRATTKETSPTSEGFFSKLKNIFES